MLVCLKTLEPKPSTTLKQKPAKESHPGKPKKQTPVSSVFVSKQIREKITHGFPKCQWTSFITPKALCIIFIPPFADAQAPGCPRSWHLRDPGTKNTKNHGNLSGHPRPWQIQANQSRYALLGLVIVIQNVVSTLVLLCSTRWYLDMLTGYGWQMAFLYGGIRLRPTLGC